MTRWIAVAWLLGVGVALTYLFVRHTDRYFWKGVSVGLLFVVGYSVTVWAIYVLARSHP